MNEKNISLNKKIISLNENFCLAIVPMSIFSCNDIIVPKNILDENYVNKSTQPDPQNY